MRRARHTAHAGGRAPFHRAPPAIPPLDLAHRARGCERSSVRSPSLRHAPREKREKSAFEKDRAVPRLATKTRAPKKKWGKTAAVMRPTPDPKG